MITPEYLEIQRQMHRDKASYGKYSSKWAEIVMTLCATEKTTDVLDYGCGKGELNLHLPFAIHCYDPAVPKYEAKPAPADIVVCTDVLEHVEEQFVDEVLDDLKRLTRKYMVFEIATGPAKKHLPDGRNAHITQRPVRWWLDKLEERFEVYEMSQTKEGMYGILEARHVH